MQMIIAKHALQCVLDLQKPGQNIAEGIETSERRLRQMKRDTFEVRDPEYLESVEMIEEAIQCLKNRLPGPSSRR